MKKIAHIVPTLEIGGAELAALSIAKEANDTHGVEYMVFPISKIDNNLLKVFDTDMVVKPKRFLFSYQLGLLLNIYKYSPSCIIMSLWKSVIISSIYCFLFNKKQIFFLHSSMFFNFFDRFLSKYAMKISDLVLVDSISSKNFFESLDINTKCIKFTLLLRRLYKCERNIKSNKFVFIGRVARIKNIEKSIEIFKEISESDRDAVFDIYGPINDKDYFLLLSDIINKYGLQKRIKFKGELSYFEIPYKLKNYKFFIQTSFVEGMAISVTDAMQLGIVPIVSGVGEIRNYCIDNENAIIIDNSNNDLIRIKKLMYDDFLYESYSNSASKAMKNYMSLKESLRELLLHCQD